MLADRPENGTNTSVDSTAVSEIPLDAAKLSLLFNASRALASTTDVDQLLSSIISEVRKVLDCEGAAVVLRDEERDDFYWRSVQDDSGLLYSAREEIRFPKDQGVGGWVFRTGQPALVNDAANDPRVYRGVDSRSGFTTRNIVCVPLKVRDKLLGLLYALNRTDSDFSVEDVEILMALSTNVAMALENAAQYESLMSSHRELERLNRVKNKILNHLSHELKTPLAIIEASLGLLERRLKAEGLSPDRFPFKRILRNLDRLKEIEKQVGHIVEEDYSTGRQIMSKLLDHLKDLIEMEEEDELRFAAALRSLRRKIEELFPEKTAGTERVAIEPAFQAAEYRVRQMTRERQLDIRFLPPDPVMIKMQPQILMSVIGGLIRNAVENTPEQGRIVIKGERTDTGYRISVTDFGVGIPQSEQLNIFEGFYPVQETDLYSSGSRYEFNAGGTGTDLLKIKIFSERLGFKISFKSTRCSCIPTVRDVCPGNIAACSCCSKIEDCLANGGTEFKVEIPEKLLEQPVKPPALL